jgi:predicted transposase YdaD
MHRSQRKRGREGGGRGKGGREGGRGEGGREEGRKKGRKEGNLMGNSILPFGPKQISEILEEVSESVERLDNLKVSVAAMGGEGGT